jgi:aspartyl protease family protein
MIGASEDAIDTKDTINVMTEGFNIASYILLKEWSFSMYYIIIRNFQIIILVVSLLFCIPAPLYAQYRSVWDGIDSGLNQGIENARRIQEMQLMQERRRMLEEERQQLEQQRHYNEELKRKQEEREAKEVKKNDFIDRMDRSGTNWRTILEDPDFQKWLNENAKRHTFYTAIEEYNTYDALLIINEYNEALERQRTAPPKPGEVKLIKKSGVYEVPVTLNNVLSIYFVIDSGAADISISPDVALTLIRTKTIKKKDWLSGAIYRFADGSIAKSQRFKLRSVKIGDVELKNVTCSISNSLDAPMLLGQSALQKLKRYSIDYDKKILTFNVSETSFKEEDTKPKLNKTSTAKRKKISNKKQIQLNADNDKNVSDPLVKNEKTEDKEVAPKSGDGNDSANIDTSSSFQKMSESDTIKHERFIANDDGTVIDTRTNLMWPNKDNYSELSWDAAERYCENYRGGGHDDWRMPTLKELEELFDSQISGAYGYGITDLIELTHCCPWASDLKGAYFNFDGSGRAHASRFFLFGSFRALPVRNAQPVTGK